MVPCIFQLSELGEFGLVLQEQNKDSFMRRFADCVKALLFAKVTQGYAVGGFPFAGNAVWESNPATVMSVWALSDFKTDLKADWALLKEMMVFTPDYGMQKLIAANLRFLQRCRARMAKLADRGLWYLFCHCRRYRSHSRYYMIQIIFSCHLHFLLYFIVSIFSIFNILIFRDNKFIVTI